MCTSVRWVCSFEVSYTLCALTHCLATSTLHIDYLSIAPDKHTPQLQCTYLCNNTLPHTQYTHAHSTHTHTHTVHTQIHTHTDTHTNRKCSCVQQTRSNSSVLATLDFAKGACFCLFLQKMRCCSSKCKAESIDICCRCSISPPPLCHVGWST